MIRSYPGKSMIVSEFESSRDDTNKLEKNTEEDKDGGYRNLAD